MEGFVMRQLKWSKIVGGMGFGVLCLPLLFAQGRPQPDKNPVTGDIGKWRKALLNYNDLDGRKEAIDGLFDVSRQLGHIVTSLTFALHDPDPGVRAKAAYALGRIGPSARPAANILVRTLENDKDWKVREQAAYALTWIFHNGRFDPFEKKVITSLAKAMTADEETFVRVTAIRAFRVIGPEAREAAPELLELMKQKKDQFTRELAAASFGALMDPSSKQLVPTLLELFKKGDENPHIERTYLEALRRIGDKEEILIPICIEAMHGPKRTDLRAVAASVLGKFGPKSKEAVPALVRALDVSDFKDESASFAMVSAVVEALGSIGPDAKAAVPALKKIAANKKAHVGLPLTAERALEKIEKK
jgi:HEAT repeat protein